MAKRWYDRPYPSRYTPLVVYLSAQEGDSVTLSFTEIEALIGQPLSLNAQVSLPAWTGRTSRIARDLRAIGRHAHLRVKQHAVEFQRVDAETQEG